MARKEINTQIEIKATPAKVWNALMDIDNYPNWNPFIRSIEGKMEIGEALRIELPDMKFYPKILVCTKNKKLVWQGKLLFDGVFDGEHSFLIRENINGTVTFCQDEIFTGILVGLFTNKLERKTKAGFESMNESLKQLVEVAENTDHR